MEDIEQKKDWEKRFTLLSDSILYMNGYTKEEIESFCNERKLQILQSLDLCVEY